MQLKRICQLLATATILLTAAVTYGADDFPGGKPDRRIITMQEKVDTLFEKGDYERAYFIYREELVPLGDKYAQYMVGYMTLVGKGVPGDLIAGSAWYRLAAERGDSAFVQSSNEVLRLLNEEQRKLSDQRYLELRREYSDVMIVANLIEKDLDALDSRVDVSSMTRDLVGAQYYNKEALAKENAEAVARVEDRLSFLAKAFEKPDLLATEEIQRIDRIENRAFNLLQTFKDRD
jgi:TPR repeat protein